jgi:hypothetical protein
MKTGSLKHKPDYSYENQDLKRNDYLSNFMKLHRSMSHSQ